MNFIKVKKYISVWCLSIILVWTIAVSAHAYSSVLTFGDSLSDNGQYGQYSDSYATSTNTSADVYGFMRFSNGPVWVEYLANSLSTSLLDMAYGGATSGWDNPAAGQTILGLLWQVSAYASSYGSISSDTLITVWAGGNDMFNYYRGLTNNPYNSTAYTNYLNGNYNPSTVAANIADAIEALIALGGTTFVIPDLEVSGVYAAWISAFDAALSAEVQALIAKYGNLKFYLLNTGNVQTEDIAVQVMPDGVHPTTAVHERFAEYALAAIPEPASIILLVLGFASLAGLRRKIK